jgi:hypothetical protein
MGQVNFIDKGIHLIRHVNAQGYRLNQTDGVWQTRDGDEDAVNTLIAEFDPLPIAQVENIKKVKDIAEATRLRFITPGSGKSMTYLRKEQSARAFKAAGYTGDAPEMIKAVSIANNITAKAAADLLIAKADAWEKIGAFIEQIEEAATKAIEEAISYKACSVIAEDAIETLEGV